MQGDQEKNEYLDYSYTRFSNESRGRTNSQQTQPQYSNDINQSNLNNSFTRQQQPIIGMMPPMNGMQGVDMMSFMQQMQQMQQMMNMFQMMQQPQSQSLNQSQFFSTQESSVPRNLNNYSHNYQNPVVNIEQFNSSSRFQKQQPRRQFRQQRQHNISSNNEFKSNYSNKQKSQQPPFTHKINELDNYIYEQKKVESAINRKIEKPIQQIVEKNMKQQTKFDVPTSTKNPIPFDQIPIRPKTSASNFDDVMLNPIHHHESKPKVSRASKKNLFLELQQKPVKGLSKNYDQIIDQLNPDVQEQREPVPVSDSRPKNFLKAGSRQFLSSARSKIKPQKKNISNNNDTFNKSKKIQISKATPKNKDSLHSSRFKIDTEDGDQSMYRSGDNIRQKDKSPKPISKPITKSKPPVIQKKQPSQFSSVQQIYDDEQKVELIPGVIVTLTQFSQIKQKYMMQNDDMKQEMTKMKSLKYKYQQMTRLIQKQKSQLQYQLSRQKQLFQEYKQQQMKKINNQKRVAQRQRQAVCNTSYKKQKQQLELQKKQWEKQKDQWKKKDISSKHVIEKLKKQVEDLKRQLSNRQTESNNRRNTFVSQKQTQRDKKQSQKKPKFSYKNKDKSVDVISDRSKDNNTKSSKNTSIIGNKNKNKNKNVDTESQQSSYSQAQSSHQYNYDDLKYNNTTSKLKSGTKNTQSFGIIKKQQPSIMHKNNLYTYEQEQKPEDHFDAESEQQEKYEDDNYSPYEEGMTIQDLVNIELSIKMVTDQMIEDLFHYDTNSYYTNYLKKKPRNIKNVENDEPGKVGTHYTDGSKQIVFENGVKKQMFPSGYSIIHFKNKDVKQKLPDGTILYFFKQKNVDQITLPNQMNIYRFQNNQVEFHYPDGLIEIRHADGTFKAHNS